MRRYMYRGMFVAVIVLTFVTGCGAEKGSKESTRQKTEQSQPQAKEKDKKDGEEIYELGRQDFDDCDGSGHGYREIYYSDGSMEIEEY